MKNSVKKIKSSEDSAVEKAPTLITNNHLQISTNSSFI